MKVFLRRTNQRTCRQGSHPQETLAEGFQAEENDVGREHRGAGLRGAAEYGEQEMKVKENLFFLTFLILHSSKSLVVALQLSAYIGAKFPFTCQAAPGHPQPP